MSGPRVEQTGEVGEAATTQWPPAVLGAQTPPLGRWWFGSTAEEELEHRRGLVEAADRASRRLRNYDQPWWAANVRGLLEYVALLEEAVAAAEERGRVEGAAKERERWELLEDAFRRISTKYTYAPGPGGNIDRIAHLGAADMAPALAEWIRQQYRSLDKARGDFQ